MNHPHHYRNNSFSQSSYPQDWDSSDNPNNYSYTNLQQRPLQPQKINTQSTSYIDKAFSLNNTPNSSDAFHNKLQNLREKFFGSSNDSQKGNPPPLFTKQPYHQASYGTRTASPQMNPNHQSNASKSTSQWAEETRGGSQNSDMRNSKQLLGFHRSSIDYYNEQRNMYMIEEEVVQKAPVRNQQTGYFHARSQSNPMVQEPSKYSEVINIFESSENTDPTMEHEENPNYSYVNKRMPHPQAQAQGQAQENKSAKKFVTVTSGYSQSVVKEQKIINSFLQGKLAAINKPPAIQIPKNNVKKFSHVTSRINSGISPNKAQHIPSRIQYHQQPQHQPRPSKSPKKSPLPSPTQHKKKSPQKVTPSALYKGNTFGQYEWTDQDEGWISYNPNAASNNNNKSNKSSLNNVESVEISPRHNRGKSIEEVHIMEKGCLNMVMALQNVTFKRINSVFQSLKNVLYTLPEEEVEETSYNEEQEASFGPNPTGSFNEKVRRSQERVLLEENQVLQGLIKINNLFINVKALVDRTKLSTFHQIQFQSHPVIEESPQNKENVTKAGLLLISSVFTRNHQTAKLKALHKLRLYKNSLKEEAKTKKLVQNFSAEKDKLLQEMAVLQEKLKQLENQNKTSKQAQALNVPNIVNSYTVLSPNPGSLVDVTYHKKQPCASPDDFEAIMEANDGNEGIKAPINENPIGVSVSRGNREQNISKPGMNKGNNPFDEFVKKNPKSLGLLPQDGPKLLKHPIRGYQKSISLHLHDALKKFERESVEDEEILSIEDEMRRLAESQENSFLTSMNGFASETGDKAAKSGNETPSDIVNKETISLKNIREITWKYQSKNGSIAEESTIQFEGNVSFS